MKALKILLGVAGVITVIAGAQVHDNANALIFVVLGIMLVASSTSIHE